MSAEWRLSPHFLVRSTGFPIDLLLRLECPDSAAAADELLDGEADLATLAGRLERLLAADRSSQRRKWWKKVHKRRPVGGDTAAAAPELRAALADWDRAVTAHDDRLRAAAETFQAELAKRRADLRDIVADPRFGEAVWLSSPQMYTHGRASFLAGRGGASALRRVERQLIAYLQRFCAKNDTAAFFGPIDYGGVGKAAGPPRPGRAGPGGLRRREAFVAAWAVTALASAVAADPPLRPYLRPRLGALYRIDLAGGVAELPGHRRRRLDAADVAVLAGVDGERQVVGIAQRAGRPVAQVLAVLDRLAADRIVRLAPEPRVIDSHPVRWLHRWLSDLPATAAGDRWREELGQFVAAELSFAETDLTGKQRLLDDLERRFALLTGESPRRGGGAFYADRLLVYEEAAGDTGPLRLEPAAGERLRRLLAPVLECYAAHAYAVQAGLRAAGAAKLAGTGPLPLVTWVGTVRDGPVPDDAARAWQEAVRAQLRGRENASEVELDLAAVPAPEPGVLDAEVLVSSPDVMLLAADEDAVAAGSGELVIGECHDTALVWGWPLRYHPDPGAVEHDVAELLRRAAGDQVLANVLPSRRIKIIPFEYPGPTIELAATSTKADEQRIAAADVTVRLCEGRPRLAAPGQSDFVLYNGELHTLAHRIVALPRVVPPAGLETGAHTPRLRVGPVIIQRERWRVAPAELFPGTYRGDSFALLLDYRRAASRLGLPRFVFARVPGQVKPVYVDGRSWLLLTMLYHLIREEPEVTLTEMLPDPEQLWLTGAGGSYCAELRLTMARCPEPSRSAGDAREGR